MPCHDEQSDRVEADSDPAGAGKVDEIGDQVGHDVAQKDDTRRRWVIERLGGGEEESICSLHIERQLDYEQDDEKRTEGVEV